MNIAVAVKVVPDDQDIQVNADRTLNYSKARPIVSTYDLNAIEAAAKAAADEGAKLYAVSVGDESIVESKLTKNILARGVDEMVAATDAAYANLDTYGTAQALAAAVKTIDGGVDLVVCGDGSADLYAQQVDVQLACALGWPVVTAASEIAFEGGKAVVTRLLENEKEIVEVALPAVVSVVPDIALPRICGMKDILAAGKKPIAKHDAAALGADVAPTIEVTETLAPEPMPRKKEIFDAATDGDIDKFVEAIKEAIK